MSEELLRIVEPDLDSITHETLHMIIAIDDFGLRPSLEMSQLICRRLIRAERERDEARARIKVLESVLAQYPNEEHAAVLEAGK